MRDDTHKWDAPRARDARIKSAGVTINTLALPRQTLVSGPAVVTPEAQGWPGVVHADPYSICLRRDRVLVVGEGDHAASPDHAVATSDASDLFVVLEVAGPAAFDLLCRGAELSLNEPSRSCMRQIFGITCVLYRYEQEDRFRLHVPAALDAALWHRLSQQAALP